MRLLNGSTNADRTNYWEVVPTSAFELALWMESDRMAHLLPALTPAKFDNQREVVLNERRQNYENRPYGLATMATVAALFPPDHPYSWLTIGSADDLRASTLDEARTFFETFYHPGNASLAIAGDIDVEEALDLVDAYFGDVPAGPDVGPVRSSEPQLAGPVRLLHEDRVELPRLYLAWHSPAMFAPGDAELDLIADVLTNGKNSRLYHCARLHAPHRDGGRRVPELTRAGELFPGHRDCRAGTHTGRARTGGHSRRLRRWRRPGRPKLSSSAAWPRRRHSSSTGCRQWAGLAASRTS